MKLKLQWMLEHADYTIRVQEASNFNFWQFIFILDSADFKICEYVQVLGLNVAFHSPQTASNPNKSGQWRWQEQAAEWWLCTDSNGGQCVVK